METKYEHKSLGLTKLMRKKRGRQRAGRKFIQHQETVVVTPAPDSISAESQVDVSSILMPSNRKLTRRVQVQVPVMQDQEHVKLFNCKPQSCKSYSCSASDTESDDDVQILKNYSEQLLHRHK